MALYGYANLIWIPVALISWSPISSIPPSAPLLVYREPTDPSSPVLNYVFVAVGFAVSALFLFRNLYPVLSATDIRTSKILLIVVVALHAGLAIAIKILFFAHGGKQSGESHDGDDDDKGDRMIRMLFRG
jgi:protein YIPF1/2